MYQKPSRIDGRKLNRCWYLIRTTEPGRPTADGPLRSGRSFPFFFCCLGGIWTQNCDWVKNFSQRPLISAVFVHNCYLMDFPFVFSLFLFAGRYHLPAARALPAGCSTFLPAGDFRTSSVLGKNEQIISQTLGIKCAWIRFFWHPHKICKANSYNFSTLSSLWRALWFQYLLHSMDHGARKKNSNKRESEKLPPIVQL